MKRYLILLLFLNLQINSQTYVSIPDPIFATYLQALIPAAMSGSSLNTTSSLVTSATHTINVYGINISNLTGVQYFSSLKILNCGSNSLTNLPSLPDSLITLTCNNNFLTILPTLPGSLQALWCDNNSLTSLPILPNTLKVLECHFNSLTNLPSLPNSLLGLACGNNSLTNLPPLPGSLQSLSCFTNSIKCFPYFPGSITMFGLSGNPFTCLPNYVIPAMPPNLMLIPLCSAGNVNGCPIAGLEELTKNNFQISLFPIPNNGNFEVHLDNQAKDCRTIIINSLGQMVYEQNIIQGTNKIEMNDFPFGIYNFILYINKQKTKDIKFIIDK